MTKINDKVRPANVRQLLAADGPFPELTNKLMLFGQFVGSWDVHSTNFKSDGTRTEWQGEWHFAWILGGRGIQDVLLVTGAPAYEFGTTLRCYDAEHDVWHTAWMVPAGKEYVHLVGAPLATKSSWKVLGQIPGDSNVGPSRTLRLPLSHGEVRCRSITIRRGYWSKRCRLYAALAADSRARDR